MRGNYDKVIQYLSKFTRIYENGTSIIVARES